MSSLGGIFNNGVSGMMAFTDAMGTVSDNIANINTVGYKKVDTQFATLLGEQDTQGSDTQTSPLANSSTNGVNASTRQLVNVQGPIQTTNRSFDLAISGTGMFTFADNPTAPTQFFYGRGGNLDVNLPQIVANGTITTGTTGYLANGNGQFLMAQAITTFTATAGGLVPVIPAPPTSPTQLVPINATSQTAFAGQATTLATLTAIIPAAGANSVSAPINYDDSSGTLKALTVTWSNPVVVGGTSTTWNVTITDANGTVVGANPLATMAFDGNGQPTGTTTFSVPAAGATFNLDLSKVTMLGNATNVANGAALALVGNYSQNGLPSGTFQGLTIDDNGLVTGHYSGGATKALYQIPFAIFASPNKLQTLAGDVFQPTADSGNPQFVQPGNGLATLNVGALESSNADLADSFTQMIVTQRAYQAAAQVVKVADQMSTVVSGLQL